jgi:nitrogen-specific signal transduction histidine kinase
MNSATTPILVAIILQLGLGLGVFQANPRRKANQCFLLLSLVIGAWLASLFLAFSTSKSEVAAFYIREASAFGAIILTFFNLLRLSIQKGDQRWRDILNASRIWLIASITILVFCQTKLFLLGTQFVQPVGATSPAPKAIYGNGSAVYLLYFVIAGLAVIINYTRDVKRATARVRAELAFILIGAVVTLGSVLLAFALGLFIERSRLVWFAPFRIVLFSLIIAYGIATRKIMEVGLFLRRVISYTLLTLYLLALYTVVWWLVTRALHSTSAANAREIAHVAAAIVIAFAMAPARGVSRRLAERLFISSERLDFRATVNKATEILSSVTTLHDLLQRFANTIAEAVGADRVLILLHGRDEYTTRYALSRSGEAQPDYYLPLDGPVANYLKTHREPVVVDELHRIRQTPEVLGLINRMHGLKIVVAMGIFSREHLAGIMLLGPRTSGRIYGSVEQNALQVLCGQLAVAIDNAQLFTEVQNARIYNETLLENLTTGVIAAGIDERITVFNNEAGQILKLDSSNVLDRSIDHLPASLSNALRETLRTGEGQENLELLFGAGEEGVTVRASTSIFQGEDRQVLGALMVLTDITALKRLESQIRRSDRLASLGTLSAGMAHEIKNPLVSIKTFAQLLPERYEDSDFRETFSNLIGHEIDRIDSLVNQLLRFARPAKPQLRPMHVHEVLDKALLLVGHRLYQKDIKLTRSWDANVDTIRADGDQLEQVFLNFFINAMDAMKNGGELTVSTQIRTDEEWISPLQQSNGQGNEILRVTIRDSGEGIRGEDLPHVFDPFFTTKDYGTGLGLSVVHGIIQEHGGQIEVESELKKGTSFHILLPLVRLDSEVAAA